MPDQQKADSVPLSEVDEVKNVSIEVRGLQNADSARDFVATLLSLQPSDDLAALAVQQTENGFLVTLPPICCMWNRQRWGFVWNGVCEWRGMGCPA
jgi:hypothetical protein